MPIIKNHADPELGGIIASTSLICNSQREKKNNISKFSVTQGKSCTARLFQIDVSTANAQAFTITIVLNLF
jgi:hypothetical protein